MRKVSEKFSQLDVQNHHFDLLYGIEQEEQFEGIDKNDCIGFFSQCVPQQVELG